MLVKYSLCIFQKKYCSLNLFPMYMHLYAHCLYKFICKSFYINLYSYFEAGTKSGEKGNLD